MIQHPRFLLPIVLLVGFCSIGTADEKPDKSSESFDVNDGVVYAKRGDKELKVDVYVPKKEGKHPGVLVVHGGAWRYGSRKQLAGYARQLALRNYVAFAIEYRLAPTHKFPAQIEDCREAVRFIRQHADKYRTDAKRLGAVGYSAGGHLVSLLATTGEDDVGGVSTRVQAVAAGGAPTEFRFMPDGGKGLAYWLGGLYKEKREIYKAASSAAFASKDDAPIYFYNGDADTLVPLIWTQPLMSALKNVGVEVEMFKIEGAGHIQAAANSAALEGAWKFFDRHLQSPKAK